MPSFSEFAARARWVGINLLRIGTWLILSYLLGATGIIFRELHNYHTGRTFSFFELVASGDVWLYIVTLSLLGLTATALSSDTKEWRTLMATLLLTVAVIAIFEYAQFAYTIVADNAATRASYTFDVHVAQVCLLAAALISLICVIPDLVRSR